LNHRPRLIRGALSHLSYQAHENVAQYFLLTVPTNPGNSPPPKLSLLRSLANAFPPLPFLAVNRKRPDWQSCRCEKRSAHCPDDVLICTHMCSEEGLFRAHRLSPLASLVHAFQYLRQWDERRKLRPAFTPVMDRRALRWPAGERCDFSGHPDLFAFVSCATSSSRWLVHPSVISCPHPFPEVQHSKGGAFINER